MVKYLIDPLIADEDVGSIFAGFTSNVKKGNSLFD